MQQIRVTIPGEPDEQTFGIALETATRYAQDDIRNGRVPAIEDAIRDGVKWRPEPPGVESFDPPSVVMARGWGDCDDLAPWLAGEMRESGFDSDARAIAVQSGPTTWHAMVEDSDGKIYDPSKWAGMPHSVMGGGAIGQGCPCCKPLRLGKGTMVVGRGVVRVDVPGILASRGCQMGIAHQGTFNDGDAVDQVRAVIRTLENAMLIAHRSRTGDARALRQLAAIYRIIRGDDPEEALVDGDVAPHEIGLDSSAVRNFIQTAREVLATAADELFSGDTWTLADGHAVRARKVPISGAHMGVVPCLAALGPLAGIATTAGTIAAVAEPLAAALQAMVGSDSDFGKVLRGLRDALGPIKIVSTVGAGIEALAASMNIPQGVEAASMRWAELLRSPLEGAGVPANRIPDVARAIGWTEQAMHKAVPPELATRLAPQLVDLVNAGRYQEVARTIVKESQLSHVADGMPFDQAKRWAEQEAAEVLAALASDPEAIMPAAGQRGSRVLPDYTPPASEYAAAPALDPVAAADEALAAEANDVRKRIRTVPVSPKVPPGWDPIFAMGCRQAGICK